MQSVHKILLETEKTPYKQLIDSFTKFCLVVSALCHDVGHTGRTNFFEMNSLSQLAVRYHDRSVLEQYHAATSVKMLQDEKTNFLTTFNNTEFRKFRKMLISNILQTDMTEHFQLCKDFENRIKEHEAGEKKFGVDNQEDDVKILCGVIIHTADFNGASKPFPVARKWSQKVTMEYIAQYEEEEKNGYQLTPYMKGLDKLKTFSKSEMGFYKMIVRPLYFMISSFLSNRLQECVNNLDESIIEWEKLHNETDENTQWDQSVVQM